MGRVVNSVCMSGGKETELIDMPAGALVITGQYDLDATFAVTQWYEEGGLAIKYDNIDLESSCDVPSTYLGATHEFEAQCNYGFTTATGIADMDANFKPEECKACDVDTYSDLDGTFCVYEIEIPCETTSVACTTPAPTAFATASPTVSPEESTCLGKMTKAATELDFFAATLGKSELNDGGVLEYKGIGSVKNSDGDDTSIDLVVSIVPGTEYYNNKNKNDKNGMSGAFGNINVVTVAGDTTSGEGNFRFCFVDSATKEPTTVESFAFSVYDLDQRNDGLEEKFIMDISQVQDYYLYPNVEESEIKLSCNSTGLAPPCADGDKTVFHSSTKGGAKDNPTTPNTLDERQKKRSIVFTFKDTECFDFTYDHYCGLEATTGEECGKYTGGNFLFAGNSQQVIDDGHCYSPPPTMAPKPTDAPTEDWVKNGEPTDDDIIVNFPEPECPNDIKVIKTTGVTQLSKSDAAYAVQIISKTTTAVTVSLNQVWNSKESIDKIYYEYQKGSFDSICPAQENVDYGSTYAEEIEIQCNVLKPFAKIKICLEDSITKDLPFLNFEDKATIPKCCHAQDDNAVCYLIEINCTPECAEEDAQQAMRGLRGAN